MGVKLINQFKRKKVYLHKEEGILPTLCIWTQTATLTLPTSLPADFGLASSTIVWASSLKQTDLLIDRSDLSVCPIYLFTDPSIDPSIYQSTYIHAHSIGSVSLENPD